MSDRISERMRPGGLSRKERCHEHGHEENWKTNRDQAKGLNV